MTKVFFVRHAQPIYTWKDDRTRPLTDEGLNDSKQVTEKLKTAEIDCLYSSPYKRSFDTISDCAAFYGMQIITDERLRERQCGDKGNAGLELLRKRWVNFDFHEEGGECLKSVQNRNIAVLSDILVNEADNNIVVGTHGTALSTILNYYDSTFGCDDFLRIIDYTPYIIRLDFNGYECIGKEEMLIIEKKFV